jgi:Predicted nucleic acid-binding protein, contains PIN domain
LRKSADLLDSNVWLALAVEAHTQHLAAKAYWERSAAPTVAFCRVTEMTFLRLLTNKSVMGAHVLSPSAAWSKLAEFLRLAEVQLLAEPHGLDETWGRLSIAGRTSPNLWTDSYLAAFATRASLRIVTFDKGFAKFADLDSLILNE